MRVLMLNRRDSTNPEGGGSEIYLEKVAAGLVARGHEVTIFCGAHDRAPAESETAGVRFLRRGSKLGVHREAVRVLREQVRGGTDVIVDVQNGIPFFSPAVTPRTPIVILVHHVHREQWPVVYEPTRAKIGWLLESQVSPRLYRSRPYVAVSNHTKVELTQLGVSQSASRSSRTELTIQRASSRPWLIGRPSQCSVGSYLTSRSSML